MSLKHFYDYFPVLLIILFTIFACKFLWVSVNFRAFISNVLNAFPFLFNVELLYYLYWLVGFYWSFYYVVPTVDRNNKNTEDDSELQKNLLGMLCRKLYKNYKMQESIRVGVFFFSLVTGWTIFRAHPDDIFF